ncbi:RNA polymerase sigma factor [Pseudobacter ginsenosidimutans]|uniref:RNA polymerase sigma-70 factor (ECF subfamily) n=1 Tax=Pseudobacter ginsenosidimutans TaxID=661488 RepID=A0A4Q7N2T9_9BACT|nr:sigma-70 family RNA polymerase sigma factor [Pseudobacter ginsenosidimutans]RZS74475.1 RNA polymerase sigma-70 factor (ECF subfamily) [Pseudobacter ginsenosidimutans]
MKSELVDEPLLIRRCVNGDRTAFSSLYSHYAPLLYRLLYPLTRESRHDAEEIIQDVFLSIWEKRELLPAIRNFKPFLFRMARNKLIDLRRKSAVKKRAAGNLEQLSQSSSLSPEEDVLYIEYHSYAMKAIAALPPRQRQIFDLRMSEDLSLDQIAAQLQITTHAVKKNLYTAIRAVKEQLRKNPDWFLPLLLAAASYC